ncbi:hypothetical protein [Bremerella volcania]|uniref:hypothetical protein n=1 Tax=Bremerella volcania TaxID=2527984 RepID=UPI00119F9ABC|nr:hypothetical protein [Bremerella volcania]
MVTNLKKRTLELFVLGATIAALGCSQGPPKFEITGNVTLDGQPITTGSVMFSPTDGSRDVSRGDVVDGRYTLECGAGEKIVQIAGFTQAEKVIPWTYAVANSGLTASVSEDAEMNFDLTSQTKTRRRR